MSRQIEQETIARGPKVNEVSHYYLYYFHIIIYIKHEEDD